MCVCKNNCGSQFSLTIMGVPGIKLSLWDLAAGDPTRGADLLSQTAFHRAIKVLYFPSWVCASTAKHQAVSQPTSFFKMPIWKLLHPEIAFRIQNRNVFCFINTATGFTVFSWKFTAYSAKLEHVGGVLYVQGRELWLFPFTRHLQVRKAEFMASPSPTVRRKPWISPFVGAVYADTPN